MKDTHMPISSCHLCGGARAWNWEDAFRKDGFDNGINSQTETVVEALIDAGYDTTVTDAYDNTFIDSIRTDGGIELIADHTWKGETEPREYLPQRIISLLETAFPLKSNPAWPSSFEIDPTSDARYLHFTVKGKGRLVIANRHDGIMIDVYPLSEKPKFASCLWVPNDDLLIDNNTGSIPHPQNPATPRITAEFVPQAWMGDIAMTVDPEGDTVFDVTDAVLTMGETAARALRDNQQETDHLRDLPTAPAWIRDWSGPFRVEVEESIAAFFQAFALKA